MAHPGDRFGPYELTERLVAEGAFEHWMAVRADGTQREPIEVEIRLSVRPSDEIALSALRGEYNALRILADARIVRPVSFFAQQAAIALEYQEGVTLEEVIEAARQRLIQVDLATTADIGLELAHALRHVHSIVRAEDRIVHGGITTRSVTLTRGGDVLLTGVGRPHARLSAPWRPPEDKHGTTRDAATDLWQLGAVLTFLATCSRGINTLDLVPRLRLIGQESQRMASVLGRCLAPDPLNRYPHEGELIRELYAVFHSFDAPSRRREIPVELLAESADVPEHGPMPPASMPPASMPPASMPPASMPSHDEPPPAVEPEIGSPPGVWARTGVEATDPGIGLRRDRSGGMRAIAIDDEPDTDPASPYREGTLSIKEAVASYEPRGADPDIWVDTPPDVGADVPQPRATHRGAREVFEPPDDESVSDIRAFSSYDVDLDWESPQRMVAGLPLRHWVVAISMTVAMTFVMLIMLEDVL